MCPTWVSQSVNHYLLPSRIVQPCSCTSQELASEHIWDLQVKPMTAVGNPLKMLLIKSMRQIIQLELILKRLKKQNKKIWGKRLVKRNEFKIQHHHKKPAELFQTSTGNCINKIIIALPLTLCKVEGRVPGGI